MIILIYVLLISDGRHVIVINLIHGATAQEDDVYLSPLGVI